MAQHPLASPGCRDPRADHDHLTVNGEPVCADCGHDLPSSICDSHGGPLAADPELPRFQSMADRRCTCAVPDRMTETPDDAAQCAYCGGYIDTVADDEPATIARRADLTRAAMARIVAAHHAAGDHSGCDDEPRPNAAGIPLLPGGVGYAPDTAAMALQDLSRCHDCGHLFPDRAAHEQGCPECDDLAQTGTYAPCATVDHSPWGADDDAELSAAMRDAAHLRRDRYYRLLISARRDRAERAAVYAPGSIFLAHEAARSGLVPSPDFPDNVTRQRELLSLADPRRVESSTYQASSSAFEQRHAILTGRAIRWPIYATGRAAADR